MELRKGNVVRNLTDRIKRVVIHDRKLFADEEYVCEFPHEDGDMSYLCGSNYCRCAQ